MVTGRKEDVNSAKREILSAADHFSQIRAQRKNTLGGANGTANGLTSNVCNATGQCTIQVRVPYRVVGLVVGPKGKFAADLVHSVDDNLLGSAPDPDRPTSAYRLISLLCPISEQVQQSSVSNSKPPPTS